MRIDAIPTHEQVIIIAQLAQRGSWRAERKGAAIMIAGWDKQVQFSVTIRGHIARGAATDIAHAIEDINDIVAHGRPVAPQSGRVARDPSHAGMAPLIRHRHSDSIKCSASLLSDL